MFSRVDVEIENDVNGLTRRFTVPCKFKSEQQFEEMQAYHFDAQLPELNAFVAVHRGPDWYINDEVCAENGLEDLDPEHYVDFTNK